MNPKRLLLLAIPLAASLSVACGSSRKPAATANPEDDMPEARLDANDFFRPELINSEFTDEVDDKRYKAIGNVLDEVSPKARVVYFVGKLRKVPTQAQIQVRWLNDNIPEPVVVTDVYGSDTFSFISTFTRPGRRFMPGNYSVRVIVNGQDVGGDTFVIRGKDPFKEGVKVVKLKFSKKTRKNGLPIKPDKSFKSADEIWASFVTKNVMSPTEMLVSWYRGDSLFNESVIQVNGNGRFTANIASPTGLPQGAYAVEISADGMNLVEKRFTIGNASFGPTIDHIALGEQPGKGSMPKKETTSFKEGIGAIHCGLRFLDLEPNSEILIEWVLVGDDGESVYHKVLTPVAGGGSGSMSAQWAPGNVYAGNYKAVVYINGELATEKAFTVQ